jgi:hypothetical protein
MSELNSSVIQEQKESQKIGGAMLQYYRVINRFLYLDSIFPYIKAREENIRVLNKRFAKDCFIIFPKATVQQCAHWTLRILRASQAFSGFGFFLLPSRVHARRRRKSLYNGRLSLRRTG